MNKKINKTIATVAASAVVLSSAFGAAFASEYTHGRTLKVGSRGQSVKMLQMALNSCFGANISADGVFGRGTRAEVIAAQKELGLRGDGVVGPATGAKMAMCESIETETTTTTTGGTTTTTTTTTVVAADDLSKFTSGKGMEVRTRNFQVRNASNAQAEEGAKGVEVARFTFDVQQSDALIERINIYAKANGTVSPTTPWRVFDKITVMVNGKEAGSIMTSNASTWDDLGSGFYKIVAGGLATVAKKDTTVDIRLVADINAGANGQTSDVKWDLFTDASGIRMTDEAAITQYTGLAGYVNTSSVVSNASTFTIKNVGSLTTAKFSVGSNDPKSTTLEAKKNASSSDYTIQEYTIKAEDGDIKLKTVPAVIQLKSVTGGTQPANTTVNSAYGTLYTQIIDTAWVTINGEKFDSVISKSSKASGVVAGSTEENIVSFDVNRRVTIKAGETATVKVMVKFKSLPEVSAGVANIDSGIEIKAYTTPSNAFCTASGAPYTGCSGLAAGTPALSSVYSLENGTGDTVSTSTGSATGYAHTVRTTGLVAVMGAPTISKVTASTSGYTTSVTYSIPLKVTAIGSTFYGAQTAVAADTVSGTDLVAYVLQKATAPSTSVVVAAGNTGAPSGTVSSDAPLASGNFRFDDGSTRTVTVNVTVSGTGTTASTESVRAALKQLKVYTDAALTTGATTINLTPVESFQTNYETVTRGA